MNLYGADYDIFRTSISPSIIQKQYKTPGFYHIYLFCKKITTWRTLCCIQTKDDTYHIFIFGYIDRYFYFLWVREKI